LQNILKLDPVHELLEKVCHIDFNFHTKETSPARAQQSTSEMEIPQNKLTQEVQQMEFHISDAKISFKVKKRH
jgi:hypothetical protein